MKNFVDLFSISLHRAVADKMVSNEAEIIRIAQANLALDSRRVFKLEIEKIRDFMRHR